MPLPPHASVGEPGTETSAWGITLHRSSLAVTKVLPRPLQYSFPPIPLSKKRVYCGKEYCYTCGERALAHGGVPTQGVAVAANNRMIPRTEWADYALSEGISIVIIKAACGG